SMIDLWDVNTGRPLHQFKARTYDCSFALSPDAKTLAVGDRSKDQTIWLWDVTSGKELRRLHGHRGWVPSVAFSPDSKTLAAGDSEGIVRLWDVNAGKMIRQMAEGRYVESVTFSPDGKTVVAGGWNHVIYVWDTATGKEVFPPAGHQGPVTSIVFSRDGR